MEQFKPLSDFFTAIENDPRISITHIGIYAALLQFWKKHHFGNPFYAYSRDIMRIAKVSASSTYHKSIRQLSKYGYIKYEPSYKRNQGSKVYILFRFNDIEKENYYQNVNLRV